MALSREVFKQKMAEGKAKKKTGKEAALKAKIDPPDSTAKVEVTTEVKSEATEPKVDPVRVNAIPKVLVVRKRLDSNAFRLIGGIVLIIIGCLIAWVWMTFIPKNPVPAVFTLGGIGGGIYFIKLYFDKRGDSGEVVVLPSGMEAVASKRVNSLSIYPDKVIFENLDNPAGQPWKCHNDGRLYYVQVEKSAFTNKPPDSNPENWRLKPFILPDQRYYDPGVFATRVLELPAHRQIFRRKQSMLEQLTPAMVIIAVVVFGVIMIATIG